MTRTYRKRGGRKAASAKKGGRINWIEVSRRANDPTKGLLKVPGSVFPCALGRGGTTAFKREGDGATPVARMRLLGGYLRDSRFERKSRLPLKPIPPQLGWCEVPGDRNYNRPVRMPYAASHERMRREDDLYDACIVLDWNIRPRTRGKGSAIFFHLARPGFTPTAGCVAVTHAVMRRLLPLLSARTVMTVRR